MKPILFFILFLLSLISLVHAANIGINWIYPTSNINVNQTSFFNISVNVSCSGGDCGNINVTLDPSSTVYNFTTCGASGMTGPNQTQCNTNYTGTTLAGLVTVTNGTQNFTVPATGTYTIEAAGAAGGSGMSGAGGNGSRMIGTFSLTAGTVLQIIVGQKGVSATNNGGGGGASYVFYASSDTFPLIAAGAGGGSGYSFRGNNSVTTINGTNGWGMSNGAGINGNGSTQPTVTSNWFAGGGAGWLSNGVDGTYTCTTTPKGGKAPRNNATGGTGNSDSASTGGGGFGGGGGAAARCGAIGGGGGGGYSGGGSGGELTGGDFRGGGGGGSYNSGTNQNNTAGINPGNGYVTITYSGSAKSGTVSMNTSATPFYTTTQNPYNLTLNQGQSQTITWNVNATGTPATHSFFVYANLTSNLSIGNQTSYWNITIQDLISPSISIIYPTATTYNINVSQLNYTYSDYTGSGSCWYSNSSGIWNSSSLTAGTNFTNVSSIDGSNTWTVYCNDSSNNIGSSSITFSKLIPKVGLQLISPTGNINATANQTFQVSAIVSCSVGDCGNINVTLDPSSTIYNFTTCGASGMTGPNQTQCNTNYTGTSLAGLVGVTSGIQNFTVPATGTYTIEVAGARGSHTTTAGALGGNGSRMIGTFSLTQGTVLQILVGQMGPAHTYGGAGGGGSFVANGSSYSTATPLIVAGGGGGASSSSGAASYGIASVTTINGTDGSGMTNNKGTNGNGGGKGSGYAGAGGAGFYGNGTAGYYANSGGKAFIYGGSGGTQGTSGAQGGFGGGGANGWWGGGAGGGYSGGGGGSTDNYGGGGGGSYNNGTDQNNTAGINSGDGYVTITYSGTTKGGTVSMNTSATPFYTTTQNPYNVSLNAGQSQTITWTVNSTGIVWNNYTFFIYANMTSDFTIGNMTSSWNVTIVNFTVITNPVITISYPSNTNYVSDVSAINYSVSGAVLDKCWYSLNSGLTNSSSAVAGTNFTSLTSTQGSNTWTIYCNDSDNLLGSSSVTFNKDTIYPLFSSYQDNNASLSNSGTAWFNVTIANTNGTVILNINNTNITATNLTSSMYNASVSLTTNGTYAYYWISYGSGILKNYNTSEIKYYIVNYLDVTPPLITIISPENRIYTNETISFNISSNENLSSCLVSTDNFQTNYSLAINSSLTGASKSIALADNSYTAKFSCLDLLGNVNNTASTSFSVNTTRVVINSLIISPYSLINGSNVLIYVSASNAETIYANITLPNSTTNRLTLTNNANTTFSNTKPLGRYNITIFANSSLGEIVNSTDYFETFLPLTINLTFINNNSVGINLSYNIYYRNNLITSNSSSNGSVLKSIPNSLVDLEFKTFSDKFQILLRDINLTLENNKSFGVNNLSTPIQGYLKTYGINNTFNFTNATLKIYYSDSNYSNEDSLKLHKCNSWNFNNESCSVDWIDITNSSTQDKSSHIFEYLTTSFSGFSIKQGEYCGDSSCNNGEDCSSCTSDCGSCPAQSSNSGGGGGLIKFECQKDSDCNSTYSCYNHKCVKLFDAEILEVQPLINESSFRLKYLIKGMAEIKGDVIIKFWIQDAKGKVMLGQDTIYLDSFEQKTKLTTLNIPSVLLNGTYDLYMEVNFENYQAQSFRKINLNIPEMIEKLEKENPQPATASFFLAVIFPYFLIIVLLGIVIFLIHSRQHIIYRINDIKERINPKYYEQARVKEIKTYEKHSKLYYYIASIEKKVISSILLRISRKIKLNKILLVRKTRYINNNICLSSLGEKYVYSNRGDLIGRIEKAIIQGNRIYGWVIAPDKRYKLTSKILIKHENIIAIHDAVFVDKRIEDFLLENYKFPINLESVSKVEKKIIFNLSSKIKSLFGLLKSKFKKTEKQNRKEFYKSVFNQD
jgi:sporulation protein YlmC with PRC-barrel domain